MKESDDMKGPVTVDFHAHILPGADHGSDRLETSLRQLDIIASYGIEYVVATPHFYPTSDNLDRFFSRINDSVEELKRGMRPGSPKVFRGAEVLICDGIDRMEGLEALAVDGTNCILLEMPMTRWNDATFDTVDAITRSGLTPVMVHIDRYEPKYIDELMKLDVLAQLNPGVFASFRGRRFAEKWLSSGKVAAVGSDLHMANEKDYKAFANACVALKGHADAVQRSMKTLLAGAKPINTME